MSKFMSPKQTLVAGILGLSLTACFTGSGLGFAEDTPSQATKDVPNVKADVAKELAEGQLGLAERYQLLEQKFFQLHEYEAPANPERSRLLKEAFETSQRDLMLKQLKDNSQSLSEKQWKDAIAGQEKSLADLKKLLDLLESEDRSKRVRDRQDQIKRYIAEVDRLLRIQQGIRGQTEGGVEEQRLSKSQQKAAERTKALENQIKQDSGRSDEQTDPTDNEKNNDQEATPEKPDSGEPNAKPPADKPDDSKPDDSSGKPKQSDPQDKPKADSEKSEGQPSESPPNEGQPNEGQPSDANPSQGNAPTPQQQQQQQDDPVRKRIQAAEQRMRDAQKKLDESQRKESVKEMEQAEHELAEAKRELEEILKQLREEEVERSLAMLEERFRRMLEQEIRVQEKTKLYSETPVDKRNSEFEITAGKLGVEQQNIAADADRALLVLYEDASSVAFPETVRQMRDDMEQVASRLTAGKVDLITQDIEGEIIDTLNDLVAALIQAQKDQEEQRDSPPPGQSQPGQPGEMPLVDQIAELKMIRGLQQRINNRHKRYSELIDNPQDETGFSDDPEIRNALQRLADRQRTVQSITRDIVLGKNQ